MSVVGFLKVSKHRYVYKIEKCLSRPFSGHTLLYTYIWLSNYEYSINFFILFYFMVILRSTTGPYGRPVIEVAYGEI